MEEEELSAEKTRPLFNVWDKLLLGLCAAGGAYSLALALVRDFGSDGMIGALKVFGLLAITALMIWHRARGRRQRDRENAKLGEERLRSDEFIEQLFARLEERRRRDADREQ